MFRIDRSALGLLLLLAAADGAAAALPSIGLSTVRAVRFGKESQLSSPLRAGDRFASAFAIGDLNGDGADDLATGVPLADGPSGDEADDSGLVAIRFGRPGRGLDLEEEDVVSEQAFGTAEVDDRFGAALALCDLDGDGLDDLAVGVPGEDFGSATEAGAVVVFFGSEAVEFLDQDSPDVPDAVEPFDSFGASLACGDFDGDGRDDLAVGSPGETIGGDLQAGAVFVVPGSATGLNTAASIVLHQDLPLVTGEAEPNDRFGAALVAADFEGGGFADLVVGAPGENGQRGALHVFFGRATGLPSADFIQRDETGIGGLSEDGDAFAATLAAGDFDGDGHDDLAIGIPTEDSGVRGSNTDCGQVGVLYGAPAGFAFGRTQFWVQEAILGTGTSEAGDAFGSALAAGDFDEDGRDDLAVGAPGEFVTGLADGAAVVVMGSVTGLTAERHRVLAAGLDGWPGNAAEHDRSLSAALAAGDFDADGFDDLALGAPREDFDNLEDSGAATVAYGSLFADGFDTGDADFWPISIP